MKRSICFIPLMLWYSSGLLAQQKNSSMRYRELQRIEVLSQYNSAVKKDSIASVLKLDQPLMEIPQNIIGITSSLLLQQGALELKDVARNASGIYFGYSGSPFDRSASIQIRGFSAYSVINGMPRHANYGAVLDDQALFESIDIIKGAAGFINSVGEASGTININTKTPGSRLLKAELTGGSFGLARVAVDAGSAVKEKGFSYRFNAVYQHQDSYLAMLNTSKYVVAPVVQYNFSPKTFLLAEYDFIRGESRNGSDITKLRAAANALHDPISLNYSAAKGLPLTYYQTQTMRMLFVHRFNDRWKLTSQSQYTLAPYSTWSMLSSETYTGVSFSEQGQTSRLSSHSSIGGKTFATQLFINGKFHTGSITHQLIIGGDFTGSRDSLSNEFGRITFPFYQKDINYTVNPDSVRQMGPSRTTLRNHLSYESAYVYDIIKFSPHWILTAGARYTWYNNTVTQKVSAVRPPKITRFSQNAFSPRATLTYLVNPAMSVYFLYDQSFVPQSGLKASTALDPETKKPMGIPVDPQRNNDLELGIKKQWFNGRLLTTANGFHTVKKNVLMTDVQNAALGFKKQIGEYTSDGIELDILGYITSRLSVSANYTFVNARITKDTLGSALIGNKLPGTPQQIINTWLQYSIPLKASRTIAFSAGQTSQIKRSTYAKDVYLPNYTKLDAGISFTTPKYYIRLIADNLTNKRYVASGDIGHGYPIPDTDNYFFIEGEPVNFRITAGIKL